MGTGITVVMGGLDKAYGESVFNNLEGTEIGEKMTLCYIGNTVNIEFEDSESKIVDAILKSLDNQNK